MVEDPFAAFKPTAPGKPSEPEIPVEKKKRGRKKKVGKAPSAAVLDKELSEVRERAQRSDGVMVPIGAITACRHLTDDEIKFTIAMAGGISELSKTAQKHVVAALAKIFS